MTTNGNDTVSTAVVRDLIGSSWISVSHKNQTTDQGCLFENFRFQFEVTVFRHFLDDRLQQFGDVRHLGISAKNSHALFHVEELKLKTFDSTQQVFDDLDDYGSVGQGERLDSVDITDISFVDDARESVFPAKGPSVQLDPLIDVVSDEVTDPKLCKTEKDHRDLRERIRSKRETNNPERDWRETDQSESDPLSNQAARWHAAPNGPLRRGDHSRHEAIISQDLVGLHAISLIPSLPDCRTSNFDNDLATFEKSA